MILIQFPTRERPEQFKEVFKKYVNMARCEIVINVVIDIDDKTMPLNHISEWANAHFGGYLRISCKKHSSKIAAVNDMDLVMSVSVGFD